MRALLEFLGLVEPGRSRRAPVALPAWLRRAMPVALAVLVGITAAAAYAAWSLLRLLSS